MSYLWRKRRVFTWCENVYCTSTTQPPTVASKMKAQLEHVTRCIHVFAHLGADTYAQSVLINKISASELSRKSVESALLVGSVL